MPSSIRMRNFCFTKQVDSEDFTPIIYDENEMKCLVYQLERAASGQLHLQGFIQLQRRKVFNACKKLVGGNPHIEQTHGTPTQAARYCMKEETRVKGPYVFGGISEGGEDFHQQVLDYIKKSSKMKDIITHPKFGKYCSTRLQWTKMVFDAFQNETTPDLTFEWRQWQINLINQIVQFDDRRKVWWVVDEQGNTGKTHFTTYLRRNFDAFVSKLNHKEAAYLYQREPLVVFDIPRHSVDHVPYGLIEELKDGYIWSTKYEPVVKEFEPPIVIVFSNFEPDKEKLSADRWCIRRLNKKNASTSIL